MPDFDTPPHRLTPRSSVRRIALAATLSVLSLSIAACGNETAQDAAATAADRATAVGADGGPIVPSPGTGTLGPDFVATPPEPGGTISPSPDSWSSAHVPAGYTAVMVRTDDSPAAARLATAVRGWATTAGVDLSVVTASAPEEYVGALQKAIDQHRDLVISASEALADPMALVTASWMDQEFLVLGAELAEPTANVTAAVWPGVAYRGGASSASSSDPSTYTVERAGRALDAAVAAVVRGYAGYVVTVN